MISGSDSGSQMMVAICSHPIPSIRCQMSTHLPLPS